MRKLGKQLFFGHVFNKSPIYFNFSQIAKLFIDRKMTVLEVVN